MKRCSMRRLSLHSMMNPPIWLSSSVSNIFKGINQRSHFTQKWRSFQPIFTVRFRARFRHFLCQKFEKES